MQTARWADRQVALEGRRIGVIGTGSSGVQVIPELAKTAAHLTVFQRSPNFSVPAQNRPLAPQEINAIADRLEAYHAEIMTSRGGAHFNVAKGPAAAFTPEQQQAILEEQWLSGGHPISNIFDDAQVNLDTNRIIADFARAKIRGIVKDQQVAEMLCPYDHPFGTRRLCVDTGYYATYNRPNVTLVDLRADPIVRFTAGGIETGNGFHELDLVVFSLGFRAFTGALKDVDIRNEHGHGLTDRWKPGWRTMLGFMTSGFPNFFMVCGPGGISALANNVPSSEHQIDWIANCIAHMAARGCRTVEPDRQAEDAWVDHVAALSQRLLAMKVDLPNWLIFRDPDTGERVCMVYTGGFGAYVERCAQEQADGYPAFVMR